MAPGTRASALEIPIPLDLPAITPDVARQLSLRGAEGVLVFVVEDESPAAEAGLQRGDMIREVNPQRVRNLPKFERATKGIKEGDRISVLLQRGRQSPYGAFTIAKGLITTRRGAEPPFRKI